MPRFLAFAAVLLLMLSLVPVASAVTRQGTSGADTLIGTRGADRLNGDRGNDRLEGGGGNDVLFGGSGRNSIFGGRGADVGVGQDGADRIMLGAGMDDGAGAAEPTSWKAARAMPTSTVTRVAT